MSYDERHYDIPTIRQLLREGFTQEQLRRVCLDSDALRPVVDDFGSNYNLNDTVDEIIEYCRKRLLFNHLLAIAKQENPSQYARFEKRLRASVARAEQTHAGTSHPTEQQPENPKQGGTRNRLVFIIGPIVVAVIAGVILLYLEYRTDWFREPAAPAAYTYPQPTDTSPPMLTASPTAESTPAPTDTKTQTPTPIPDQADSLASTSVVSITTTAAPQGQYTQVPVLQVTPRTTVSQLASAVVSPKDGMVMVYVSEGELQGCNPANPECEEEATPLRAYYIDKYKVSNTQFVAFLNVQGNQLEGGRPWLDVDDFDAQIEVGDEEWTAKEGYEDEPVSEVSWYGARAYCAWVGKRLPLEVEWVAAARGMEFILVSEVEDRENPYGVLDLESNMYEWVVPSDMGIYDNLGQYRNIRAAHVNVDATTSEGNVGFRCAVSADAGEVATYTSALQSSSSGVSQIAFDWQIDGNRDIYLMDSDGGNLVRLTQNPADDSCPSWSPDGEKLAFKTDRDGNDEIYILSLGDSQLFNLTDDSLDQYSYPSWSPNGEHIAYLSRASDELILLKPDGTVQKRWSVNTLGFGFTWSPDSRRIAYVYNSDNQVYSLYVVDVNDDIRLHLADTTMGWPVRSWSPDSSRIAFSADLAGDGKIDIYAISPDSAEDYIRLTYSSIIEEQPTWSPDGSTIIYSAAHDALAHVYALNTQGLGTTLLADDLSARDFVWSPDGTQILYSDGYRLFVMNADGSGIRLLIDHDPGPRLWHSPSWRP